MNKEGIINTGDVVTGDFGEKLYHDNNPHIHQQPGYLNRPNPLTNPLYYREANDDELRQINEHQLNKVEDSIPYAKAPDHESYKTPLSLIIMDTTTEMKAISDKFRELAMVGLKTNGSLDSVGVFDLSDEGRKSLFKDNPEIKFEYNIIMKLNGNCITKAHIRQAAYDTQEREPIENRSYIGIVQKYSRLFDKAKEEVRQK